MESQPEPEFGGTPIKRLKIDDETVAVVETESNNQQEGEHALSAAQVELYDRQIRLWCAEAQGR